MEHRTNRTKHKTKSFVRRGVSDLLVKTYFERLYPHTKSELYFPSRKNTGIFVSLCFMAAGSNYFPIKAGKKYTSDDVALQRKIYDGSRPMTHEVKNSFHPFDLKGLADFYRKHLSEKIPAIALSFGISSDKKIDPECLCVALAMQFNLFIGSNSDEADDVVALEYQKLLAEPTAIESESYCPASVLYPGDQVRLKSKYRPVYRVGIYEKFEHTWEIENIGTQVWQGRKLFLSNHNKIRPKATMCYVAIPHTPPKKSVKIAVNMDARGFEDKSECKWIMVDEHGNDCFPNSGSFEFIIDTRFRCKDKEEAE